MPRARSQSGDEVAGLRVDAALAPYYAALQAEREAADRRAAQRAADIRGFAEAEANFLKGVGPTIQATYQGAAQSTGAFAQGQAAAMQMLEQQNQGGMNAFLAQQGAPEGQMLKPSGAGAVFSGAEGFIPASTLAAQGAAFASAGHMLPGTALGRGRFDLMAAQRAAEEEQRGLTAKRLEVEAMRPGLLSEERTRISERNLARQKFAEDKRQARANAKLQWESIKTSREYFGLDKKKTLQAEASFMTDMTGELHVVRNGRVVPTGKRAAGSEAYGNVVGGAGNAAKTRADALKNKSTALASTAGLVREEAKDWLGTPIENPKAGSLLNPGKYVDKNGKGTNDINKAVREGALTWQQAIQRAMQLEEVQQLITRFNMSPARARAKVKAWLRAAGFRPPAPGRPRTKGYGKTSQPKRYGPGGLERG